MPDVRTPDTPTYAVRVEQRTARRKDEYNRRRLRRLKIMFPFLLVLVFLVYAFTTNYIPSSSMEPNIQIGDHILTMRPWLAYPGGRMPARGDIVVFNLPKDQDPEAQQNGGSGQGDSGDAQDGSKLYRYGFFKMPPGDILIKRVIALPGETVQLRGNTVYINGKKLHEDYKTVPVDAPEEEFFPYAVERPLKVPEGEVFLLGDNRNNSEDGRFWGTLKRENILGKFVRVLWNEGANGPNVKRAQQEEKADQNQ
jgi:signal peptidase I